MAIRTMPYPAYIREALDYDPETGVMTWRTRPLSHFTDKSKYSQQRIADRWNQQYPGKRAGSIATMKTGGPYWSVALENRHYLQHRLIWRLMTGDDIPLIDHHDGDGLNNAWTNLRPATKSQNGLNRKRHKRKKNDLPKGIQMSNNGKMYVVNTRINGIGHHIGSFKTLKEATNAYHEAVGILHGEFFSDGHRQ